MTSFQAQHADVFSSRQASGAVVMADKLVSRRRRIDPQSGHALEMLGHAIEYLADEILHDRGFLSTQDHRVQAMEILKAANRKVYFECPVVPTLGERLRILFAKMLHRR